MSEISMKIINIREISMKLIYIRDVNKINKCQDINKK